MKISKGPITSASKLVPFALATALLVFGVVLAAVTAFWFARREFRVKTPEG